MSEVIENISDKTEKFRPLFEQEWKQGYASCHTQIVDFIERKIDMLILERQKADDFDSAILSVLIGYLKGMNLEIIDIEYPKK